ncbi:helix-turn-helix domain-containing protein [Microbacterium sp. PA5]|uniref:helix-turn-helix domain-containing protein n=1 Tax=Microbacterium sp. PA5 TaxID=3416654 RepID=UPI003CEB96B1
MPEAPRPDVRMLGAAQVAEMLSIDTDEVVALILDGRLRGAKLGSPPRWRIAEDSVDEYVEAQTEEARRMALWRESNAASFPELWGRGGAHGD